MGGASSRSLAPYLCGAAALVAGLLLLRPQGTSALRAQSSAAAAAAAASSAMRTGAVFGTSASSTSDDDQQLGSERKLATAVRAQRAAEAVPARPHKPSGPLACGSGFRLNVKNLTEKSGGSIKKLRALFEPYGSIMDAQLKMREDGKSLGLGFVVLATEAQAVHAMQKLNGKVVGGKALLVVPAERRKTEEEMRDAFMQQHMLAHQAYVQAYLQQQYALYGAAAATVTHHPAQELLLPEEHLVPGEFLGQLKNQHKHGKRRCFLVCDQTFQHYGRDIYASKDLVPDGAKDGDCFKFTTCIRFGELQLGMMSPPMSTGYPRAVTIDQCKEPQVRLEDGALNITLGFETEAELDLAKIHASLVARNYQRRTDSLPRYTFTDDSGRAVELAEVVNVDPSKPLLVTAIYRTL